MPQRQRLQLVSWSCALMRQARSWFIALAILAMAGPPAQAQPTASWNSLGPPGGTVLSLLQSPSAPSTIFAGTSQNGVFVSFDSGQTWSAANTGLDVTPGSATRAVRSLVSDGQQYLYAATDTGIFYAPMPVQASDVLTWTVMASTNASAPIALLAVDTATGTLFAAGAGATSADPPVVYAIAIPLLGSAPGSSWTAFPVVDAPSNSTVGALAVVPGSVGPSGMPTPSTLMVGAGSRVFGATFTTITLPLVWLDEDPLGQLAAQGAIETIAYSADFSQTFTCGGGKLYQALDPTAPASNSWSDNVITPVTNTALTCSAIASGPQLLAIATNLGVYTWRGDFTASNAKNIVATRPLPVSTAANAVLIGGNAPTLFVGGGFGVSSQAVASIPNATAWVGTNGPGNVLGGGSNNRLNNSNVSDVALLGTTLYAAVTDQQQYADVLVSTDTGATWTSSALNAALSGNPARIPALAADATNGIVYAGTDAGLFALKAGTWVQITQAASPGTALPSVYSMARDAGILYIGTDAGVFSLKLGPTPATAANAGLSPLRVTALHVKGGKVYAATNDLATDARPGIQAVSVADSVASGLPVWSDFIASPNVSKAIGSLDRSISSIAVAGKWLLAASRGEGVFIAEPDGSWQGASSGLPPAPDATVTSLISDGTNVYAATRSNGVYVASLIGADGAWAPTWTPFNGTADHALPSLEVHQFRSNGTVLYAATAAGLATFDGIAPIVEAPVPASQVNGGGGGGIDAWALLGLALMLVAVAGTARSARRSE